MMYCHRFVLALLASGLLACSPVDDQPDMGQDMESGEDSGLNAAEFGWLLHVQGRGPADVYVVGGEPSSGRMKRYDGERWHEENLPETPLLNWVQLWESSATVVGNGGTILRLEGDTWTAETSPTDEDLWGVWGANPDDVWAVGGRGRQSGQATILRRVEGVWTHVESPALERPGVNAWFKIWGTSTENFYIVGQRGGMLHWTGDGFEELGVGTSEDLISLDGTGPDNVVVVGGRANGVVSRWNGEAWNTQSISPAPGVNGVWMVDESSAWFTGVNGLLRKGTWVDDELTVPRAPPASELDLHALVGFEGFGLMAVGGNFEQPQGPFVGDAVRLEEF